MSQAKNNDTPVLTLITPCLDRGALIGASLESVARQGLTTIEHLVVDGGSRDATHEVVAAFPHARLIVASDRGSHDAMNKGIALARGAIIGFLNSDDVLPDGALAEILAAFSRHRDATIVHGGAEFFEISPNGEHSRRHHWDAPAREDLYAALLFGVPCFNAWFFRREVFERHGDFSLELDLSADRDFLLRVVEGETCVALDRTVYGYGIHDHSRTMAGSAAIYDAIVREHIVIAEDLAADRDRPRALKRLVKPCLAVERARLCLSSLRQRQRLEALRSAIAVLIDWPAWPYWIIQGVRRRRRIYRKYLSP